MNLAGRITRVELTAAQLTLSRGAPAVLLPPDPAALMERCGLPPDPWQRDLLRAPGDRVLLNVSRQAGKSTVCAILALHEVLQRPGSLVLMLAPSLRQSMELLRKLVSCYSALGRPVPAVAETALRLELANGSRVVSLPGSEQTIRGFSAVRLLLVDEAARCPDVLFYSISPMLAVSGGRIVGLSTPHGRRGFFFETWEHGGPGWQRVRVPAPSCPRISPAFLQEELLTLGRWHFDQEYMTEFRDSTDQIFSSRDIDAALDDDVPPLFPEAA